MNRLFRRLLPIAATVCIVCEADWFFDVRSLIGPALIVWIFCWFFAVFDNTAMISDTEEEQS